MRSLPAKRRCPTCERLFQPGDRAFNAKFCTGKCKATAYRRRRPKWRRQRDRNRSWLRTKADPARLDKHRARSRESAHKVRVWLAAYKLTRGCKDCGYREHAAALQLDHEGPKLASISELRSSESRIRAEIRQGKCVVRCANCHAVKTWKRLQRKKAK